MRYLPWLRFFTQTVVLLLFCSLPVLAGIGFLSISGSLFSLDFFGVPFADPASALQVGVQGAVSGGLPLWQIFAGAGFSLALAFFLGRVFCGWICPYGFLSETVTRFRNSEIRKKDKSRIFAWKAGIFFAVLAAACITGLPLVTWLSMPGQLSLAPLAFTGDLFLFLTLLLLPSLALLADVIMGGRFFCSRVCPQSVLLGLASRSLPNWLPGLRIHWQKEKCRCKGSPCDKACQLALHPRKNPDRRDCLMCGDCVAVCAKHGGALNFKAGAR